MSFWKCLNSLHIKGGINEKTYGSDADCRSGPLNQSLYKSKCYHHFEPDCSSEICSAPEGFVRNEEKF